MSDIMTVKDMGDKWNSIKHERNTINKVLEEQNLQDLTEGHGAKYLKNTTRGMAGKVTILAALTIILRPFALIGRKPDISNVTFVPSCIVIFIGLPSQSIL